MRVQWSEAIDCFFKKHLQWVEPPDNGYALDPSFPFPQTMNWKSFMKDLEKCPEVASYKTGMARFSPLFYVILVPDVPIEVVEKLHEINDKAIWETEDDHGWNIFQWMQWGNLADIDPWILRFFLKRAPRLVCEEKREENQTPLEFFLAYEDGLTDQIVAILECSRYATAMLLAHHFSGKTVVPAAVLTCALDNAFIYERRRRDIFGLEFKIDESPFCLGSHLFEHLESKNLKLFHRYLKTFAKARETRMEDDDEPRGIYPVDRTSLTCCVLFFLAKMETIEEESNDDDDDFYDDDDDSTEPVLDKAQMWEKYLEINREDITKPTKKGNLPLYHAIRLCHQINPIIADIWKQDPSVLESMDPKLELPPFLVAATMTHNDHHCCALGDYREWEYEQYNTVNTTYQLLRANPNMITFRTPSNDEHSEPKKKKRKKKHWRPLF